MTNTRLRLTPSEFGALWTYHENGGKMNMIGNGFLVTTPDPCYFIKSNGIELIEEHNPDFRPRWENGKLTVDPLFRMWVSTLSDKGTQDLLRSIQ